MTNVSGVIPAYNEGSRIGRVLDDLQHDYEILVIDDGSTDETVPVARDHGAQVFPKEGNQGYIDSLKRGFAESTGDIVVTMDADGEHPPEAVPELVAPIRNDNYDLVLPSLSFWPP